MKRQQLLAPVGAPVVGTLVATAALANTPPGGGANYCEWDPDLYEWICYPTATPTPTPTPTPTDTPRPVATATPTDTPRPAATPTPTDTPKPAATPTPTDTPRPTDTPVPTPSGGLSVAKSVIDVDETITVSAVNVSPSGQQVYIQTSGPLGYSKHGSCYMGINPGASVAARSWTLIGCSPPGNGSVTLKTLHAGKTLSLATITMDVQAAATATPTPTPPTPAPTPSGGLSAAKSVIDVGDTVTVSAVNVSPSDQSVYITTSGPLGYAGQSPCTSGTSAAARSWSLVGCSPPGSGSVTLKTSHNGQTMNLATITIVVQAAPTPTPTPTTAPEEPTVGPTPPTRPGGLTGTAGPGIVTLKWHVVAGATTYDVEQKEVRKWWPDSRWVSRPFDSFSIDETTSPPTASVIVAGLSNGKSYKHRVRSRNSHEVSGWTTVETSLPELPAPASFTGAIGPVIGQISLRWDAVSAAVSYEVQQKDGSWKDLPFGNVTFSLTGTSAAVGNLVYGKRYEHRVRSRNAGGPSEWSKVSTTLPKLKARGHQKDHTVAYRIEITPVAGYDPSLPNPGVIIPSAVAPAASKWGTAGSGADLVICRHSGEICDGMNTDKFIVTVKLSEGAPCYGNIACVRPSSNGPASKHLTNDALIFTEPAWLGSQRYRWTNVAADHNKETVPGRPKERWKYVGVVMLHEFGHTLGLADHLDKLTPPVRGVMSNDSMTITQAEIDYLLKIYSGHVRGE